MLAAERAENERLRQIIKELQRHRFGRRAESLPVEQLLLGLEEAEQVEAEGFAAEDTADPAKREARASKRRTNRGALPAHLPRIEQVIDIPDKICPCCGAARRSLCKRRLHRGSSKAASRPRRPSPMFWSASTPTTFRCIARRRSMLAKA